MKRKIFCFLFISLLVPVWLFAATASHVVFFSASPYGTGDLKTGTAVVEVIDGEADISVAQTGNIGAGDRITYQLVGGDPIVAYIAPCRIGYSSGSTEIKIYDKLKGQTSKAHGIVRAIELTGGSWAGGDAAGYVYFLQVDGTFQSGEQLNRIKPAGLADVATTNGTLQGNMSDKFVLKNVDGTEVDDIFGGDLPDVVSIHHEAASLAAMDALYTDSDHLNDTDLTSGGADIVVHICGYYDHDDYTVDSTNLSTTSVTEDEDHFVYFYVPQGSEESIYDQRHDGAWDANRYMIQCAGGDHVSLTQSYFRFEGFQFYLDGSNDKCIEAAPPGINCVISNNILRGVLAGGDTGNYGATLYNSYFYNNIIYGFINGSQPNFAVLDSAGDSFIYNNTVYNCYDGMKSFFGDPILKNNIVKDCANISYSSGFATTSSTNISNGTVSELAFGATHLTGQSDGTSSNKLIDSDAEFITNGAVVGSVIKNIADTTYTYVTALDSESQLSLNDDIFVSGENYSIYTNKYGAVAFLNEGADDFHLDPNDALAINLGIDLSSDATLPFWIDIDGYERSIYGDGWDIGADEAEEPANKRQIIFIEIARDSQCDICNVLDLCYGEGNLIDCLVL